MSKLLLFIPSDILTPTNENQKKTYWITCVNNTILDYNINKIECDPQEENIKIDERDPDMCFSNSKRVFHFSCYRFNPKSNEIENLHVYKFRGLETEIKEDKINVVIQSNEAQKVYYSPFHYRSFLNIGLLFDYEYMSRKNEQKLRLKFKNCVLNMFTDEQKRTDEYEILIDNNKNYDGHIREEEIENLYGKTLIFSEENESTNQYFQIFMSI
jgi:hypothetical protein